MEAGIPRREFIKLVSGLAAASPLATRAQWPVLPVVGYFEPALGTRRHWPAAFRKGLAEQGIVEGRNLAFAYRSADGQNARLPRLAADLVQRMVALILLRVHPQHPRPYVRS